MYEFEPFLSDDDAAGLWPACAMSLAHVSMSAADRSLADLANLVGSGTTLGTTEPAPTRTPPVPVQPVTPDIEMVDAAPPLTFDLERELDRAFAQQGAPRLQTDASFAQTPTLVAQDFATSPAAAAPDVDFADSIADELDRALRAEFEAEAAAQTAPLAMPPLTDEFANDPAFMLRESQPTEPAPMPRMVDVAPPTVAPAPAPFADAAPVVAPPIHTPAAPQMGEAGPAFEATDFAPAAYDDTLDGELRVPMAPISDRPANRGGRKAAIALMGIALLGATGAFAYSLVDGGASAPVPVILADTAPAKVKPADVGGSKVPNQDQAVYAKVDGKTDEPVQTKLKSAVEKPMRVSVDRPVRDVTQVAVAAPKSSERILAPKRVRTTVVRPDGTIVSSTKKVETQVNATAAPAPKPAVVTPKAPAVTKVKSAPAKPVPVKVAAVAPPKVAKKPVKKAVAKPVAVKPVKTAPAKPVKKQAVSKSAPKVASLPQQSSPYAVQIASLRSPADAKRTAKSLQRRYASVLSGRGIDIRKGVVKGRDYYRVRVPAASRGEANTICSRFKSAGGNCFVTR